MGVQPDICNHANNSSNVRTINLPIPDLRSHYPLDLWNSWKVQDFFLKVKLFGL